ncbi:MAG TPA: hypothetical protein DCE44_01365, partial [Verrucomicrobiales bacterium]|nr:hypothetical protein [Verrucomicrobiales bacterium]
KWLALLDGNFAEKLARRREEMRPEIEAQLRRLEGCLGRLPEDQRSLVEGYYYRREEIANLAGQSGRTVTATYKALQRIRQALQNCLEQTLEPEGVRL